MESCFYLFLTVVVCLLVIGLGLGLYNLIVVTFLNVFNWKVFVLSVLLLLINLASCFLVYINVR